MDPIVLAAIVTAVGAVIGALVSWTVQRRQVIALRAQTESEVRANDVEALRGIIAELRVEVDDLQKRVVRAEARAARAEECAAQQALYVRVLLKSWNQTTEPPPPPGKENVQC